MNLRVQSLLSWLGLPIYVWQGLAVRNTSIRLEPPAHTGWINAEPSGKKKTRANATQNPIKILLIGDSSAAGVGVSLIENSLGGQLPQVVADLTGRRVNLRIAGNNSATSGQIRDYVLPHLENDGFDFVCLNIGTNDAKNFHRARTFCKNFGTLIYALRSKYPTAKIVWPGIVDMEKIPTLPSPLNKILGYRSRILCHNGQILCTERGALAPEPEWQVIAENFCVDGFHASEKGYREWAENLGKYLVELLPTK